MAKAGFCSECNANVYVGEDGTCQYGHPAECVSNVYETEPAAPAAPEPVPAPAAPPAAPMPAPAPAPMPAPAPGAPAAYAPPPATPGPVPPGTPPPAKKSKALMITLIVIGVLLLCCIVAGIGAWLVSTSAFNSAKTNSEKLVCFSNERTVEGAATTLKIGEPNTPLPTDYTSLISKLEGLNLITTDPKCPAGGTYTWTVNSEGNGGTVDCSIHGHYSTTQPLPSP